MFTRIIGALVLSLACLSGCTGGDKKPSAKPDADSPAATSAECFGRTPTIVGTDGADSLRGTSGPDVIASLGGDDTVSSLAGDDLVCAGDGDDVVRSGIGTDRVSGDAGADRLNIGPQDGDRVSGGEGDDVIVGKFQNRAPVRPACADYALSPEPIVARYTEQLDPSNVRGHGRDVVEVNCLIGSPHGDTISHWFGSAMRVKAGAGNDVVIGTDTDDALFGGPGADQLRGGSGRDRLRGGDGDDVLEGDLGADLLDGGPDVDLLDGGDGNDEVRDASLGGDADSFDPIRPDRIRGGLGADRLEGNGEDQLEGGEGNDLVVNLHADYGRLQGGPGEDRLVAARVSGGAGLVGGAGDDILEYRGRIPDTRSPYAPDEQPCATYEDSPYAIRADLRANKVSGHGNDTLINIVCVQGSRFGDVLLGSDRADVLVGGAGDDFLDLGPGNDHASGGLGHDQVHGGAGEDTANGFGGGDYLDGGSGNDVLRAGFMCDPASGAHFGEVDSEPATILGGDGDDYLQGDQGSDYLDGGAGEDTGFPGLGRATDTLISVEEEECH